MPETPTTATHETSSVAIDGRAVRQLRKLAGHTITGLASECGISVQYLSAIEIGRRPLVSPPVFARICDALGVDDRRQLLMKTAA